MRKMKRLLSLVLTLVMTVSIFTACGENKKEEKKENKAAITATAVKYSKDGKYTTTVKSDTVDLSKISAKNVEVSYTDNNEAVSDDTVKTAVTKDKKTNESETVKVKVESVKANSDGGYDIIFTDENAVLNPTSYYDISFTKAKEKVTVAVDYPEITLTPDIKFVTPSDNKVKVSLAIKGSEFEEEIKDSDITLDNAFKKMSAKIISSSANNLTLELQGKIVKNEAGAYQWGKINVSSFAVKDAYGEISAKVDVKLNYAGFDASSLKFSDGKITAELKVYGVADVNKLTKDNVKVDGVTTEAVEKKDDNTLTVTFSAKDIENVNGFVDKVSGKKMTLGEYKTEVELSQSKFYPVFDFVEQDGDNFALTLKLYSLFGTFDKGINIKQFSFADGFKDAKAESVKLDKDGIATLIISVPSNGQTSEKLNINGTITLAADALVNAWGDKASKDIAYTREYSNETLGKDVTLNKDTLLEIQKFTRGKNTTFGTICYWGGVAGQVGSIAKTILEVTGVIKSEHVQVMEKLEEINKKIDGVLNNQKIIMRMLDDIKKEQKESQNDDYKDKIDTLSNYVNIMEDELSVGALYMALEKAKKNGEIEEIPSFEGLDGERLNEEVKKYEKYIPITENMSEKEIYKYSDELVDFIIDQSKDKKIRRFASFENNYNNLREALLKVTNKIKKTDGTDPFTRYDELCSMKYNFDSQCYFFRALQRDTALALMARAMAVVSVVEKGFTDPTNPTFTNAREAVKAATKHIDEEFIDNLGHAPEDIKAFPRKETKRLGNYFISDLAVGGDTNAEAAKKALTDHGYLVIDRDLNEKAGGHFVYLGYKVTTDFDKAIKHVILRTAGEKVNALKHSKPIPAFGESGFVNNKGDLNHKAGGNYIYLTAGYTGWWTYGSKSAISELYINGTKEGSVQKLDLNKSAGGSDLYLHKRIAPYEKFTGLILDNDPEYYPYSYVLGKKVSIGTRQQTGLDDYNVEEIKNALKYPDGSCRAWTGDEREKFVERMGSNTLEQEFKSAGINGAKRNFAISMSVDSFSVFGDYIPLDSNSIKSALYENFGDRYGECSNNNSYKRTPEYNFTFMNLYDYSQNKTRVEDEIKVVSSLASYTNFRSDRNTPRTKKIDTIIVDEAKSNYSIEKLGSLGWCPNYGIDSNGKIGAYVKESIITDLLQRPQYDDRAVSIYLASEDNYPYKITDKAYDSLVKLIADICKRNGIKKFVWDSNKDNRVNLRNGANCVHAIDFAYRTYGMNGELFGKMGSIAKRVNEILNSNK